MNRAVLEAGTDGQVHVVVKLEVLVALLSELDSIDWVASRSPHPVRLTPIELPAGLVHVYDVLSSLYKCGDSAGAHNLRQLIMFECQELTDIQRVYSLPSDAISLVDVHERLR